MPQKDTKIVTEVNVKIFFLLNPFTIKQLANDYRWALRSTEELDRMSDEELKELRTYNRDTNYYHMALELANRQFQISLMEFGLTAFKPQDLKRSWCIDECIVPEDRLGLLHHWIMSSIPLVVSDNHGRIQKPLDNYKDRDDIITDLFDRFIVWAVNHEKMTLLTKGSTDAVSINKLKETFTETLDVIVILNPDLNAIFSGCEDA